MFSPRVKGPRYFRERVPAAIVQEWNSKCSLHVVAQAELLPLVLARMTWFHLLQGAWSIYLIDNDSVKAALVSGNTKSLASMELLALAAKFEIQLEAFSWYSRVPSPSNISDEPSRLSFKFIESFDSSCMDRPKWPVMYEKYR